MIRRIVAASLTVPLVMMLGLACGQPAKTHPSGDELALHFELMDNQLSGGQFEAALTLTNNSSLPLSGDWQLFFNFNKKIAAESLPPSITATYINGDFWRIDPTSEFEPIPAGSSFEIPFTASGWFVKASEAPAGPYFVFRGADGQSMAAESVSPISIGSLELVREMVRAAGAGHMMPTSEFRYQANSAVELLPSSEVGRVLPTPLSTRDGSGRFELNFQSTIGFEAGLETEAAILSDSLGQLMGQAPEAQELSAEGESASIVLATGEITVDGKRRGRGDEAYQLAIDGGGVRITGSDEAGVFYGVRTLTALAPIEAWADAQTAMKLDAVTIEDVPRFGYRGLHLDVARNFHSAETVMRLLEASSLYKLNRFHFHLSDDEGWRLAIEELPELTEVGGRRGHTEDESEHLIPSYGSGPNPDNSNGSGSYSRIEMVEMLQYARDRHIQVVPEIDLPGHARAAIKAMDARASRLEAQGQAEEAERIRLVDPQDASKYRSVQGWDDNVVDACRESTYAFIETVIDEIVEIWAEAEAPLEAVHIGGDEVPAGVWTASPSCEQLVADSADLDGPDDLFGYFMRRVNAMLSERGLVTAGWEEIALAEKVWDGNHVKAPDPDLVELGLRPYVWNNVWGWGAEDLGYRLANTGYDVVLSSATNLYFDLAYSADPSETGYTWAGMVDTRKPWEFVPLDIFKCARFDRMGAPLDPANFTDRVRPTAEGSAKVLGIQGQLWSENSKGRDVLEYQAFPKLLGLAERAWAPQPEWARTDDTAARRQQEAVAWNEFANRLGQRDLSRLDGLLGGVAYRLPLPGAVIKQGMLRANSAFPGLEIRYSTDGSEPGSSSALYTAPVEVEGEVKLATFDGRGRRSRIVTVNP